MAIHVIGEIAHAPLGEYAKRFKDSLGEPRKTRDIWISPDAAGGGSVAVAASGVDAAKVAGSAAVPEAAGGADAAEASGAEGEEATAAEEEACAESVEETGEEAGFADFEAEDERIRQAVAEAIAAEEAAAQDERVKAGPTPPKRRPPPHVLQQYPKCSPKSKGKGRGNFGAGRRPMTYDEEFAIGFEMGLQAFRH